MSRTELTINEEPGRQRCRRLLFFVASLVATALVFAPSSQTRAQFHALVDEIVVAAVTTPHNPLSPYGPDVSLGVRQAVTNINANGGLLGKSLRVVEYADDCSAASGAAVATRIVADGAAVVVGHICSSAAIAAAVVYAKHQIIMITPGARAPKLTAPRTGPHIYRLAPREDRFGPDTVDFLSSRFPAKRIALVHDKSLHARTLADALEREMKARSIQPVLREAITSGEREYNKTAQRLATAASDIVFIPALPIEARIIFDRWQQANPSAVLIGGPSLAVPDFQPQTARAEDLILMLPTDSSIDSRPSAQRSHIEARSQASIETWAAAVRLARTVLPGPVSALLGTHGFTTTIGDVYFNKTGDALIPAFAPHFWRDGRWQPQDFKP